MKGPPGPTMCTSKALCGLIALGGALAGCGTTVLSAQNSVTPVMLGPVHRIGGGTSDGLQRVDEFHSESSSYAGGGDGSSMSYSSAVTVTDLNATIATGDNLDRTIVLDRVSCKAWAFFFLVAAYWEVGCEAHGKVLQPTPKSPAKKEVPPVSAQPPEDSQDESTPPATGNGEESTLTTGDDEGSKSEAIVGD